MSDPKSPLVQDSWTALRAHTAARIALGRSGASLPTQEVLGFGLAHAQARDAVHTPLDVTLLQQALQDEGWSTVEVHSRAPNRGAYLARPDWGRRLHAESATALGTAAGEPIDLLFVVSDGLSSAAVQAHAAPLLRVLKPLLDGFTIGPIVIATQARVALADEAGQLLRARLVVSIIGERPGLSSPDSLGCYVTFEPRVGRNDGERNCISNIRPQGLVYGAAALQLSALIRTALRAQLSGVALRFDPARALSAQ